MLPSEAEKKRLEVLRRLSNEKRLKIGFQLNVLTRKMAEAGIRSQHPGISPQELKRQIAIRIAQ